MVPNVARRMLDAQDFNAVVWVRVVRELLAGRPVSNEVPVGRAVGGHGKSYDAGPEGKHAGGCQHAQGLSHRGHHECKNELRTTALKAASRMNNSFFQITRVISRGNTPGRGLQPIMADGATASALFLGIARFLHFDYLPYGSLKLFWLTQLGHYFLVCVYAARLSPSSCIQEFTPPSPWGL
jgi:hypothetical protein